MFVAAADVVSLGFGKSTKDPTKRDERGVDVVQTSILEIRMNT
jgi:hypothetical protein